MNQKTIFDKKFKKEDIVNPFVKRKQYLKTEIFEKTAKENNFIKKIAERSFIDEIKKISSSKIAFLL